MAQATWKPAKKAYTKSQKRLRVSIKEEFDWVLGLANRPGHPMNPANPATRALGVEKWVSELIRLNNEYKLASDGRDELINNFMLLFALSEPELFAKATNAPKELTTSDRDKALVFLRAAQEESPKEEK